MSATDDRDDLTPAERQLLDYIASLRARDLGATDDLMPAVLRAARWQVLARPYLQTIGVFAGALGAGATGLLGARRR